MSMTDADEAKKLVLYASELITDAIDKCKHRDIPPPLIYFSLLGAVAAVRYSLTRAYPEGEAAAQAVEEAVKDVTAEAGESLDGLLGV